MKALFFVIEGGDGAGKKTQTTLAENKLREAGHDVLHQEFPRYGNPSAYVTEQYLGRVYGKLPPKMATILYTVDRYDAWKTKMEPHLNPQQIPLFPNIVFSDRWVTSNKGHQAGKGTNPEERKEIVNYINTIEHEIMGLPKATQTVYLDSHPLLGQRLSGIGKNSKVEGKDLHEGDIKHLLDARRAYLEVAKNEKWAIINSMRKPIEDYTKNELLELPVEELLRSREDIHQDVYNSIKKYL